MTRLFQRILDSAPGSVRPSMSDLKKQRQASRDWYRNAAMSINKVDKNRLMNDPTAPKVQSINPAQIGSMFMFFYDPKWKEELPYYDRFPVIFPISFTNKGFLGINLHYLAPILRAKLMDALYKLANNKWYDHTTKLKLSYEILNSASRYKWFRPCLKEYLFTHVRSKFLYVAPNEWDAAAFLPLQRFSKKSAAFVWAESALIADGVKPNKARQRPKRPRR